MIERTKPLDSNMEFIELSGTPLVVSRIGLGTWAIGGWMWGGTDEAQSIRTIHEAFDRGVNLFDTAPVYGFGRSEEILGKALLEDGLRNRVVIATKAQCRRRRSPNDRAPAKHGWRWPESSPLSCIASGVRDNHSVGRKTKG